MKDVISLVPELYEKLKKATTKSAQKAFNVLDREGIANIVIDTKSNIFWFESYTMGNNCPNYIYEWLIKYIKREYGFKYLYD